MAQPIWLTPAGSLGVIPVGVFYQTTLLVTDPGLDDVYYDVIAGKLPDGIQCAANGVISGTPDALASLQGIPLAVGRDTTSKFTVRAYAENEPSRFADRTFTLTIAVAPGPLWTTPAGEIGTYYDSDQVYFQFRFTESYEPNTTTVELYSGQLPGGLTLSPNGLLTGYIQPTPNVDAVPGYDITAQAVEPYDFISQAQSKNFQFTLRVSDGKKNDIRTFTIFVYSRDQMQASDNILIDNNTFIDGSQTTERAPFLTNASPSNIGTYRSSNHFAYQFVGEDYDTTDITYAISVNQGEGLPPGLLLDPVSGWYYGYIPDQGTTETEYSFNIVVYQTQPVTPSVTITETIGSPSNRVVCVGTNLTVGQPLVLADDFGVLQAGTIYYVTAIVSETAIWNPVTNEIDAYNTVFTVSNFLGPVSLTSVTGQSVATLIIECTATTAGTNTITCFSTASLGVGQPIVFFGSGFGGIVAAPQTIYYVSEITSPTEFKISASPNLSSDVLLTTDIATRACRANMIVASQAYPFTMTITGAVESEVTWITPTDLGSVANGATRILRVEAVLRGGRTMLYRLKPGAGPTQIPTPYVPGVYNKLPQGLELLPSGDIVGRVSFDTFALDLGATTIDQSFAINRNLASLGTTFDSTFTFTVNAYAPDTNQIIYEVGNVIITNGGTGYSSINTPVIVFSSPVGASAVTAQAGIVTVNAGAITNVAVADPGNGYTAPATITITESFGGSNAVLEAEMKVNGSRDAISVFKTFTVRVVREYNKPYQNLYIQAMPPPNDRALVRSLLDNEEIFVPEYIYRPDDPNFGKARQVIYYHAFGLEPDTLERYVSSLYENHYWKNLVLGQIETAQALDIDGNVIYEVVYSKVIDNLLNDQGQSVSKVVPLPYAIIDPADGSTIITAVYPNSLTNMRNQVIDVVGQIANVLPAWMTSKQPNGRVLGFTPAWVIAYTQPGRSKQIAYYLQTYFGTQLNKVDFKVDRYVLDRVLSKNWDSTGRYISGHNPPPGPIGDVVVGPGTWTPAPPTLTTFDRFGTGENVFIGTVSFATNLAYSDVNQRTRLYIDSLGGIDGQVNFASGDTIIFAKQQGYDGPPGSSYPTTDDGWQEYTSPFSSGGYAPETLGTEFDASRTIPTTSSVTCTATNITTDEITCADTATLIEGGAVWFTGSTFGGIQPNTVYYVLDIVDSTHFTIADTSSDTTPRPLLTASGAMIVSTVSERMAIYTIDVNTDGLVQLTLTTQTTPNEYVQVVGGNFYRSSLLYYPTSPGAGLTQLSWLPVPATGQGAPFTVGTAYEIVFVGTTDWISIGASANQVGVRFTATGPGSGTGQAQTIETVFDSNSLQFIEPVDMYDPTDTYDKYLVFPKTNILV